MEQFEFIVTLYNREDLDDFYDDMETPGGNLFIPDRNVSVVHKRKISRNTHYMLTFDEAELVKTDPRVRDVEFASAAEVVHPAGFSITGKFSKDAFSDIDDINWGLLRHSETSNRSNWGIDGSANQTATVNFTASGKNVDVVIVDGHIDPAHPEFAVNPDGTGGSRVNQFNWFSLTNAVTGGTNGTYAYDRSGSYTNPADVTDNNHGCHCGGTVAGNTQGWARDANVYNISPYRSNPNTLSSNLIWDYIREWHNTKTVNPVTGRKNPTITNNSYGSTITANAGDFGPVTQVTYRGTTFSPGRSLTPAELRDRGFYTVDGEEISIPYYFTSRISDMEDAINDGIIIVASAGNSYWKTTNSTDQDYNNSYQVTYFGFTQTFWLHRGTGSAAGLGANIVVGATSNDVNENKADFSNCGNQVDVFAAGQDIQSSLHTGSISQSDPRNPSYKLGKSSGTSMSGPQVAGVLALLAEQWPGMTQAQAQTWIVNNANTDQMADTETDNPMDVDSLQGAPNKYLRWINQRPEAGSVFPKRNFSNRPTSGNTYPRLRVRRRG